MMETINIEQDQETELLIQPWVFETGADEDETGLYPYRTVFAVDPGSLNDRFPLADLDEDAPDEVGLLMAQAPAMAKLLRRLWTELDAWRSRDGRRMGPSLRKSQDEISELLRTIPGYVEATSDPDHIAALDREHAGIALYERTGEDALRDAAEADRVYQDRLDRWERPGEEPDYGGADDGFTISSDADSGL